MLHANRWVNVLFVLLIIGGALANKGRLGKTDKNQDIFYLYSDSKTLADGENPYARTADWKVNNKYSTYFPLFYIAGTVVIKMGLSDYTSWLIFWQLVMLACLIAIAILTWRMLLSEKGWEIALFSVAFVFFNRWTIYVTTVSQIDFIAFLPLLGSLYYLPRSFSKALLLFGLSIAIKHMAIFLAPLYLIWAWQQNPQRNYLFKTVGVSSLIPFAVSLPFLIWDFKKFIMSILFSATRGSASHRGAGSFADSFNMQGFIGKLPMVAMMCMVFFLAYRKKIGPFTAAFFVMTIFMTFNSVLFNQYLVWSACLLPLTLLDYKKISFKHLNKLSG